MELQRLLARIDGTGSQFLFRFVASPMNNARWLWPATGPSSNGATFLPNETTAVSLLDRHPSIVVVTDGEMFRMKEDRRVG